MKNIVLLAMNKKGISQQQLIKDFSLRGRKIDPSFLSRIISEKQKPPIWFLFGVANILGYKIEDLFFPTYDETFSSKKTNR